MARWRSLHAKVLRLRPVRELSPVAFTLWTCLWVEEADDQGRVLYRPRRAWGAYFAERGVPPEDVDAAGAALVKAGLLRTYEHDGETYAELQNWVPPHKPSSSDLPAPPWRAS